MEMWGRLEDSSIGAEVPLMAATATKTRKRAERTARIARAAKREADRGATARRALEDKPIDQWTNRQLLSYIGGLSRPSKMPGWSYGLPAAECITGSKLRANSKSTCHYCYAFERGMYQFPCVIHAQYRRLEAIGRPLWVEAIAAIIGRYADPSRAARGWTVHDCFRWHDSGDLQSVDHLRAIAQVARLTPNVRHWIPTREYRIVTDWIGAYPDETDVIADRGGNLNIRMSAHMIGGHVPTFPRLPVTVSSVARPSEAPAGAYQCPAPQQGNECGTCRACWTPAVRLVNYALH